ncbi:MAG: N-acetylmuramoyl-L-alanine amidase [Maribacter sp.]|nr:N-acetylmuramoyl-L-alanine amidase [Maribacter sp.]MBT8315406.1 N-acetylmuramoyl-L-alanine amidase [Maribacter sp.]NNK19529.1 hypothetical protein [Maribacter sp.]
MTLSKNFLLIVFVLLPLNNLLAQDPLQTVVAKNGDGIFSLLRNEGIDIVKYYAQFLELNEDKLKNGSHLIVGEEYLIPDAPDSFKRRGTKVLMPDFKETPIFEEELASLKIKDSTLKHAVFYILMDKGKGVLEDVKISKDGIATRMARKLLQSGARVYLLNSSSKDSLELIDFVTVINKKFLKHTGDYQRLLVINTQNISTNLKTDVAVYHYAESQEGKKFADNIVKMFGKNTVKLQTLNEYSEVFVDDKDITFAKNILPTITFIDMGLKSTNDKKTLKVTTNRKNVADLITSGILSDYSNTVFEDN